VLEVLAAAVMQELLAIMEVPAQQILEAVEAEAVKALQTVLLGLLVLYLFGT
jgi:hypothetical protein